VLEVQDMDETLYRTNLKSLYKWYLVVQIGCLLNYLWLLLADWVIKGPSFNLGTFFLYSLLILIPTCVPALALITIKINGKDLHELPSMVFLMIIAVLTFVVCIIGVARARFIVLFGVTTLVIILLVGRIYTIQRDLELSNIEVKNKRIEQNRIKRFKSLIVSDGSLKIEAGAKALGMKPEEFIVWVVKSTQSIGEIKINDDCITIPKSVNMDQFITMLDANFKNWQAAKK
jgi:hypothetical protein